MNKIVILAITALIIGIAPPNVAVAQTAKDFVGTWTLVSATTEQGGAKTNTFGPNAKGVLMFDANGRYMIMFTSADIPKVVSNNRLTATADQNNAIVGGSIAHFGNYDVNDADKSFTFKVESSTFPNWNKTEQNRSFVIAGDELKYTVPASPAGGTATIVWKHAK